MTRSDHSMSVLFFFNPQSSSWRPLGYKNKMFRRNDNSCHHISSKWILFVEPSLCRLFSGGMDLLHAIHPVAVPSDLGDTSSCVCPARGVCRAPLDSAR